MNKEDLIKIEKIGYKLNEVIAELWEVCAKYSDEEINEIIAERYPLAWDLQTAAWESLTWADDMAERIENKLKEVSR